MSGMTAGVELAVVSAGEKRCQMTEQEIDENYRKQCSKCRFRGVIGSQRCCDYILITGKPRGCSPVGCNKFEKGKRTKLIVGIVSNGPGGRANRQRKETEMGKHMIPSKTYIGIILEDYMKENHLNQRTLADRLGTTEDVISDWRLGRRKANTKSVERVASALGMNVEIIRDAVKKGLIVKDCPGGVQ